MAENHISTKPHVIIRLREALMPLRPYDPNLNTDFSSDKPFSRYGHRSETDGRDIPTNDISGTAFQKLSCWGSSNILGLRGSCLQHRPPSTSYRSPTKREKHSEDATALQHDSKKPETAVNPKPFIAQHPVFAAPHVHVPPNAPRVQQSHHAEFRPG